MSKIIEGRIVDMDMTIPYITITRPLRSYKAWMKSIQRRNVRTNLRFRDLRIRECEYRMDRAILQNVKLDVDKGRLTVTYQGVGHVPSVAD